MTIHLHAIKRIIYHPCHWHFGDSDNSVVSDHAKANMFKYCYFGSAGTANDWRMSCSNVAPCKMPSSILYSQEYK